MNFTWQKGHVNRSGCFIPDRWHASDIPGCTLFVERSLSGCGHIGYVQLGLSKRTAALRRISVERAQKDAEQIANEWLLDYFTAIIQQLEKAELLEAALDGVCHDAD